MDGWQALHTPEDFGTAFCSIKAVEKEKLFATVAFAHKVCTHDEKLCSFNEIQFK